MRHDENLLAREGDRHGSDDGHGPRGQPPRLALLGPAQRLRQPAGGADDVEQQPARSGHAGERDRDDAGAPQPHRRRPLLRDVDARLRRPRRRGSAGAAQPGQRHPRPGGPDAGRGRAGRPAVPPGRVRRRARRPRPGPAPAHEGRDGPGPRRDPRRRPDVCGRRRCRRAPPPLLVRRHLGLPPHDARRRVGRPDRPADHHADPDRDLRLAELRGHRGRRRRRPPRRHRVPGPALRQHVDGAARPDRAHHDARPARPGRHHQLRDGRPDPGERPDAPDPRHAELAPPDPQPRSTSPSG